MAIFYVAPDGDDRADGLSPATAFASLERARDAMRDSAGSDTAYVAAGTYEQARR